MIRLHFTVEGQTEEKFVTRLLLPHLAEKNISADVRCVLTSEDKKTGKEHRGGFRRKNAYQTVKKDILNWMKEDDNPECRFTTMFDLYALPESFPTPDDDVVFFDPYEKVNALETAFKMDIDRVFSRASRFIPYIQLHEFEAFLFAAPQELRAEYLRREAEIDRLAEIGNSEPNPEMINDGPETAPSKRILLEIPEYDKVFAGVNVVERIGLEMLRQKCPHFDRWIGKLENLREEAASL